MSGFKDKISDGDLVRALADNDFAACLQKQHDILGKYFATRLGQVRRCIGETASKLISAAKHCD